MAKQKKHFESIITWHKALEKSGSNQVVIGDTDNVSILYKKARAYDKLGFLYLAQKGYKEVLKKEPQHTLAKKHFKIYEKIQESYKFETMQKNVQQFVTFEGIQNIETKISILKEIEKTEYGNLVKQFAYKKAAEKVKRLVIILNDLGYLLTKLGDLCGTKEGELNIKLRYYTDAAVFYQYVITILDKKLITITPGDKNAFLTEQQINPRKNLSHIQELMFSAIGGVKESMPFVQKEDYNKQLLKTIRKDIDRKLQRAESSRKQAINNLEKKQNYQASYVEEVKNIFESIADKMQTLLSKLYSDSEQEIGGPPCKYAVIGLGSMALRQITPYSDLEFAILTENENYKQSKDPKIKEYFKNLTHMVHFKVNNLGESVIPTSRFGVDTSHLIHRGVSFDLGGKTPLGRDDKKYELVQTIDGMLKYVLNEKNEAEKRDKNLPYILQNVCYVHGDKRLATSYKKEVLKFLNSESKSEKHGRLNCEIMAIKVLKEGTVEFNYLQQTTSLKLKEPPFQGDLCRLKPKLDVENEWRLFDVKQEIYRLPDRLIYNLGLYYGIKEDSNWDIVDKLKDEHIITPEAAFNLKNAMTFAAILRLKTYFYNEAQVEDVSIFSKPAVTESESKEEAKQIFLLSDEDLKEEGDLFQYFYTALSLHERLEAFCSQYKLLSSADHQTFFQGSDFYVDDHVNKGLIYYRLAQYKNAQSNLELALNEPKRKNHIKLQHFLGLIYYRVDDYVKAIECFDNCLDNIKVICKEKNHPYIASCLNILGAAYSSIAQYDRAIKYFEESINMRKLIYKEESRLDIAISLNNLGSAYKCIGQYDQAIKYLEDSLNMRKLIYNKESHPSLATALIDLGFLYIDKGEYDKALEFLEVDLKMVKRIYKEEPHPEVVSSLNALGVANCLKCQYEQAIRNFEESLRMMRLIFKEDNYLNVANIKYNLGVAYSKKGQYDQAFWNIKDCLKTMKTIYKDQPHGDVVRVLKTLGLSYFDKRQYDHAIRYYEDCLKMMKLIFNKEPHPDVASTLDNLGNAYNENGQYDQAIKCYEESLKMMKLIYKKEPQPDVAKTLHNVGTAFFNKGQYDQSIGCYEKRLKILKLIFKEEPHPDVASTLDKLGIAYSAKGQYDQASKYYKDSLKMMKLIFKVEPHPDVASTLDNLGTAYYKEGQYDQAIRYYEESLKMMKLIFKEEPCLGVANTLNNLGSAYKNKRQYDQAIGYYKESLKMIKLIFKEEPHPDVASTLENLGVAHSENGQYDQAIRCFLSSLSLKKLIYKEEPQVDVAHTLHNLGSAYDAKGQYDQSIKYYEDSLKMMKLIFKEEPHPDVASTLDKLGIVYSAKGQYNQAVKYFEDSLKMKKLTYKDDTHPYVANSLNNLRNAYRDKAQYD